MTDTIVVTGGTGYVASWCIAQLVEQGHEVRTTVRDLSKADEVRAAVRKVIDPEDRLSFYSADLTSDEGWDTAVEGADAVLHVASPLGSQGGDADSVIRPARDGALRVLQTAIREEVPRVVMTSGATASTPRDTKSPNVTDESVWTDAESSGLSNYQRSKVLAEKAAWELVAEGGGTTSLTTVLPGAVLGPVLNPSSIGSVQIIARMLTGKLPRLPRINLEVVDVRDLADLHLRAMRPEAAGQRFLGVGGDLMSMADVANTLRAGLGDEAAKVPTKPLPDVVLRTMAFFQEDLRTVASGLGRQHQHSNAKARDLLGWRPRPGRETVIDCGRSLLDSNLL